MMGVSSRTSLYGVCALLLALLLPASEPAQAGLAESAALVDEARRELDAQVRVIDAADGTLQARRQVAQGRKRILAVRGQARECVEEAAARLGQFTARREGLGDPVPGEEAEVGSLRKELEAGIRDGEKIRLGCEQITQVANDQLQRIEDLERAALAARLFARGPTTPELALEGILQPQAWSRILAGFFEHGSGWERLTWPQRVMSLAVFLVLMLAGYVMRRRISLLWTWLLSTAGLLAMLTVFLPGWPPPMLNRLVIGLMALLVFEQVKRVWLGSYMRSGLAGHDARKLGRWLSMLAVLLIAGVLLVTSEAAIGLPDAHYLLLRTVMAWALVVVIFWLSAILQGMAGVAGKAGLRLLLVPVVIGVALMETLGYRNLSIYLLLGASGTAAGIALALLASRMFVVLFDELDAGQRPWQKSVRSWMGLKAKEQVPGLIWLRLGAWLFTWTVLAVWVLWVWGLSESWIDRITDYVMQGFVIGTLRIAPLELLLAIAVLAFGISLTRWTSQNVVRDMVSRTRLDRGGKEAVTTLSSYVGMILSLLIALGIAGISYTNLAIIAGALSVGIGFGLQNIVNNFVSGLILLFERPIRTGDWIVVGDTQGFVRKISIRSTQIETFDRADVIVPNSELIANKVSNLMLRDSWGRVTIAIGVAYGSDLEKVIAVLLDVARSHESVLLDQPGVAPPKVIFRRFGDSALEFELRCFIRQIDKMFDVVHDLNMAIDREFRKAGIVIPFPQRDVHLKTLSPDNQRDE